MTRTRLIALLERVITAHWPAALTGDPTSVDYVLRAQARIVTLHGFNPTPPPTDPEQE